MSDTTYCNGCEFNYLCYGVDTEHCESYKKRKKEAILNEIEQEKRKIKDE